MDTPSDALLARYLAAECSPADASRIEQWSETSPAHRARLDALRAIWAARRPLRTWDVEAMWRRLRRPSFGREAYWQGDSRRWRPALAAAAAMVLLIGGATAVVRWSRGAAPMREYATARGQRITLQLPDGSSLQLAPQSRVRIPNTFGPESRDVYIDGEALFGVVHDATRPFRVHVQEAVVEDIGTRFDVRAYAEDSSVAVAVAEGAVSLGRLAAEGVVIRTGQVGTLAPSGLVGMSPNEALADYLGWAEGRLRFDNVPLPGVLRAIGRWYDLDVRIAAPDLATRSITAEFKLGAPDEMLRALALAVDARLTRSGDSGRIITLGGTP